MALKIQDPHAALILQDEIRRTEDARYDHRLHAVLMLSKGMTCPSVAEILDDSERTIRYWVKRFNEEGIAGLVEVERPGRPSRISDKQMQRIDQALREPPEKVGMIGNVWDGKMLSAFIAKEFGVEMGVRQCQRFFRHLGYRLRKPRSQVAQADPKRQKAYKKTSAAEPK
jgi:transposase